MTINLVIERFQTIWNQIQKTPTKIPTRVSIPRSHVDSGTAMGGTFQNNAHYFQVRINEMYLANSREWFSKYDPLIFVVSEFTYDKKFEAVPFIVGPTLIEKYGQKAPTGMVFSNTRVAGVHPYRGGRLTLSIILCRVQKENYAKGLLRLVENTTKIIDFSTALSTYIKLGGILLDGIETLFGLGGTESLIGIRRELDPDAGDIMEPGFFVLIDKPETQLDTNQLWVRDNQLVYGSSPSEAKPFREADYVLYSIVQTSERQDETTLPFYPLYERVKESAFNPSKNSPPQIKANLLNLYQTLFLSPDLTPIQARKLFNSYVAEIKEIYKEAIGIGSLGTDEFDIGELDESDVSSNLDKVAKILELDLTL
ncbi:hypothetical protein GTQ43_37850 [Nostoc sp. KVJ3]|uniref:hypothetical protein n=1 Tax=Nostoc sp. KVJ3 TaxID=457945 RepID=UPI0022371117|nr:hypothetical protein [Nostoc sp. KVJ3]MCW5319161.1 hypothetical protein [Nostoc sp. KVJ3]